MKSLNKRTTCAIAFLIFVGISFLISIPLSFRASSVNIKALESDIAFLTASSFVKEGDSNIINNVPLGRRWAVTSRAHFPGLQSIGSGFAWLPTMGFANLLEEIGFQNLPCQVSNYGVAFLMGNFLYLLIFLLCSFQILKKLDLANEYKWTLAAIVLGTPLFWNTFFEPAGVFMPATAFLAASYLALIKAMDEESEFNWILVGVLFSSLILFKLNLMIFSLSPLIVLTLPAGDLRKCYRNGAFLALGWSAIFALYLFNTYVKFGKLWIEFSTWKTSLSFLSYPEDIFRGLLGPNGAIFVSPLIGVGIVVLLKIGIDAFEEKNFVSKHTKIFLSILLPLIISVFCNQFLLFEQFEFGKKIFEGQALFFVLSTAMLFKLVGPKHRAFVIIFLMGSICWNIYSSLGFFADRQKFSMEYLILDPQFSDLVFSTIVSSVGKVGTLLTTSFVHIFTIWLSFFLITLYFYNLFFSRQISYFKIFVAGFFILFCFMTALNFEMNRKLNAAIAKNFSAYKSAIARNLELLMYDDFMQGLEDLKLLAASDHDRRSEIQQYQDLLVKSASSEKNSLRGLILLLENGQHRKSSIAPAVPRFPKNVAICHQ